MRAIRQGAILCLFLCISGCTQTFSDGKFARDGYDMRLAENERFLSDCALRYQDLQESYQTLIEKVGEAHSYRDDLGGFINEYSATRERQNVLVEENKALQEENTKLELQTKDLQGKIEVLDDKLKLVRDTVAHLVSSMHEKSPVSFAALKTNPMTDGIVLDDSLMFSAGQATMTAEGKNLLENLAQTLNSSQYKDFLVRVDGHTDATPVSKTKRENIDNWFLGAKRAHAVLKYLAESGVATERLSLASFGSTQPIAPRHPDEKIVPQNRRVEIVLLQKRNSI